MCKFVIEIGYKMGGPILGTPLTNFLALVISGLKASNRHP